MTPCVSHSECMGRPAPTPFKAEDGRTLLLSNDRLGSPASLRPAFKINDNLVDFWYM